MSADLDLAAIEARAAAATEGPWRADDEHDARNTGASPAWCVSTTKPNGDWKEDLFYASGYQPNEEADATFAAHARTDVPALIARIRELEGENAKIDDLDEALRQRDREILGLRRELAKAEGDG